MVTENILLLHSFLMGVYLTFIYDCLRICRRVIRHNNFWVSLEDLCYWLFLFAKVFLMLYHENNGKLRWFSILGAITGLIIYRLTISRALVKYSSFVINKITSFIGKALTKLFRPIKKHCVKAQNSLKRGSKKLYRIFSNKGWRIKKKLTINIKMIKMAFGSKNKMRRKHGKKKSSLS